MTVEQLVEIAEMAAKRVGETGNLISIFITKMADREFAHPVFTADLPMQHLPDELWGWWVWKDGQLGPTRACVRLDGAFHAITIHDLKEKMDEILCPSTNIGNEEKKVEDSEDLTADFPMKKWDVWGYREGDTAMADVSLLGRVEGRTRKLAAKEAKGLWGPQDFLIKEAVELEKDICPRCGTDRILHPCRCSTAGLESDL